MCNIKHRDASSNDLSPKLHSCPINTNWVGSFNIQVDQTNGSQARICETEVNYTTEMKTVPMFFRVSRWDGDRSTVQNYPQGWCYRAKDGWKLQKNNFFSLSLQDKKYDLFQSFASIQELHFCSLSLQLLPVSQA